MNNKYILKNINYDGSQLKPLYAYLNHGITGDSIVAFVGNCDVSLEHMIDAEDLVVKAKIKSDKMLHFIIEVFNQNIFSAVSQQRLLVCIVQNHLSDLGYKLTRSGDDLYYNKGKEKLSVSIASVSGVSFMIHLGINITNFGTPVKTCCLQDFKISHKKFAQDIMKKFTHEFDSIIEATKKVKPLG